MDIKSILIENTLLKLERGKDSGITEEDMQGVIKALQPLLKQPETGPEITYIMPLEEAVSYELSKIISKRVSETLVIDCVKEGIVTQEDVDEVATKDIVTREQLMEAELHQGAKPQPKSKPAPATKLPMDLYTLSDKLLGVYLELNEQDSKTIRIAYKKITGTNSKDEVDDLKTIIECMKATPEDLKEFTQLVGIINKLKEEYE